MKIEKVFEKLLENKIKFVLIKGTALIGYGSNRVTFDTDIAVKLIDIDKIIKLLYQLKLKLIIGVDKNQYAIIAKNLLEAFNFSETSKWGFLKFVSNDLELDVIYEFPFPFMELYNKSIEMKIDSIKIRTADLHHLKIMKEISLKTRKDKEKIEIDRIDIKFIDKKLKG